MSDSLSMTIKLSDGFQATGTAYPSDTDEGKYHVHAIVTDADGTTVAEADSRDPNFPDHGQPWTLQQLQDEALEGVTCSTGLAFQMESLALSNYSPLLMALMGLGGREEEDPQPTFGGGNSDVEFEGEEEGDDVLGEIVGAMIIEAEIEELVESGELSREEGDQLESEIEAQVDADLGISSDDSEESV